jgi:hypothetical protein
MQRRRVSCGDAAPLPDQESNLCSALDMPTKTIRYFGVLAHMSKLLVSVSAEYAQ